MYRALFIAVACLSGAGRSLAQETDNVRARLEAGALSSLGGPQSGPAQIEEDRHRKKADSRLPGLDAFFDPQEQAKAQLREETGLDLSFDYQALYQVSTASLTGRERDAASGQARILATWELFDPGGPNAGKLVVIGEHRHKLGTAVSPSGLAGEIGYIGVTGMTFSDHNAILSVAYWAQQVEAIRGGFVAGRIDPGDYTDILGYVNPRTTFQNFATFYNQVIPVPDPGFGVGAGGFLTDQIFTLGVLSDANGSLSDVEWFRAGAEFFKYAEIGWTPGPDQRYLTNVHIGAYHVDARSDAGIGESYGVLLSGNHTIGNDIMLFGRAGWSDGPAPIARLSGTLGFMWQPDFYDDLVGISLNIADPVTDTLPVQTTLETFYRFDVSDNIAVTASGQLLINPALSPAEDQIGIFGIRTRFNL
ncbi:carbohydrate porin [Roseibium sp.]|uniref:carbohydrate porin n=1 Tax=Roseibium sp. TaxID=1936156 RepID=UPI003A9811D8